MVESSSPENGMQLVHQSVPNQRHGSSLTGFYKGLVFHLNAKSTETLSPQAYQIQKSILINITWTTESCFECDLNRSLFFPQETCLSVKKFIQGPLGHYAVNVTTAAKLCSQSLCNNNGRCVRKASESSSYLHMPGSSSKKFGPSKRLRVIISAANKLKTIKDMKGGFACHCYHGWHGESCRHLSSDVLRGKNKARIANFKLSVFLSMTLSVILFIFLPP